MQTNTKSKRNWVLGITSHINKTAKNKTRKNWLASQLKTVKEYLQPKRYPSQLSAFLAVSALMSAKSARTNIKTSRTILYITKTLQNFTILEAIPRATSSHFYPLKAINLKNT